MKVGSLVECIFDFSVIPAVIPGLRGYKLPIKGKHYHVRAFRFEKALSTNTYILLEEITNPAYQHGEELSFLMSDFREIEFPPAFEKEFQKLLTPPLKVRIMSKYKEKIEALRAWLADCKPQKKKQPAPAEVWNPNVKPFNLNK